MKPLLSLLFWLSAFDVMAQWQPIDPALKMLKDLPQSVQVSHGFDPSKKLFITVPEPHNHHQPWLIKTKNGVFAGINGTGYLYKMEVKDDSCRWNREDATYYTGYNQNAFYFTDGTRIYNFGGAELFNLTGHLRFFNEQIREWGIVPLNREVLFEYELQNNIWQDPSSKHLILIAQKKKIASIRNPDPRVLRDAGRVLELDPATGTWTEIGEGKDTTFDVIANAPWGLLVNNNLSIWVVDYRKNRYYQATEETNRKLFAYFSTKEKAIRFFRDSTLYFGNLNGYLDSVALSLNDFKDTGLPIYSSINEKNGTADVLKIVCITLSFSALLFAVLFWFRKRRRKVKTSAILTEPERSPEPVIVEEIPASSVNHTNNRTILFKPNKDYTLLDERERSLVAFLLEQSEKGEMVTIDQLNKILGVSMKNSDVQKRSRSDMINSTNQKLALILEDARPAIIKQRSEFDKRSFEYTIDHKLVEKIKSIIK